MVLYLRVNLMKLLNGYFIIIDLKFIKIKIIAIQMKYVQTEITLKASFRIIISLQRRYPKVETR